MDSATQRTLSERLKARALELGFSRAGICDAVPPPHWQAYRSWLDKGMHGEMHYLERHAEVKQDLQNFVPGAKSVLVVAMNYAPKDLSRPDPAIARYALGRDYHRVMGGRLKELSKWLTEASPGVKSRATVDAQPVMERDYAHLAGLGWFGKNTCIIDSASGSWFLIGTLVTTLKLQADPPATGSCGTCSACIDACPTGAIVCEDGRWQVDARRCISYQTIEKKGELETETFGWVFGCDICQEVCPFNQRRPSQPKRAPMHSVPGFVPKRWPDPGEILDLTEEQWDQQTRGTAVRRAGFEGLKRNAKAALRYLRQVKETAGEN